MSIPGLTSYLPLDRYQSTEASDANATESRELRSGRNKWNRVETSSTDPQNIEQAAEEFEALLVAQMLKMVREAGSGGWMGSDQGSNPTMELAETQLAKALAQGGGLGIKEQLMKDLAKEPLQSSTASAESTGGEATKPEGD